MFEAKEILFFFILGMLICIAIFQFIFYFLLGLQGKGWIGEKKTALHLWRSLDKKNYFIYNDLILPSSNGTSQIDHLIVSRFGLFIIETKYMTGWIYGKPFRNKWVQNIYGKKYFFQNPLQQVYRQSKVLSEFLGLPENKIIPIIYFNGFSTFRNEMPRNIIDDKLGLYVKKYNGFLLSEVETLEIKRKLINYKLYSNLKIDNHLASLRIRHGSREVCRKCGGQMVERIAKRGKKAGEKFLGCSNYPSCRNTMN